MVIGRYFKDQMALVFNFNVVSCRHSSGLLRITTKKDIIQRTLEMRLTVVNLGNKEEYSGRCFLAFLWKAKIYVAYSVL